MAARTRVEVQVSGIVQGVGFRPFVYQLAHRHSLKGQVLNNESGVLIDLEGPPHSIQDFLAELKTSPPQLARIASVRYREVFEIASYSDFRIVESKGDGQRFVPISPDVATCADCLRELFDPQNRRYRYPFINCTNCGPRFTIIEDVPYDRAKTTMREFAMCDTCRDEYENPLDRRFHAEPTACGDCGPNVYLISNSGAAEPIAQRDAALSQTISLLKAGKIVAIKGIGGFHLACDAFNERAISELRKRKYREDKPFALMASSVEVIKRDAEVLPVQEDLLRSIARPIVLLKRKAESLIPAMVAPRVNTLGFMLPYAPLHHLLLAAFERPLVMTSANISDEPICYEDAEAQTRLTKIADYYLMHDRRIHMRMDDSVVRVRGNADNTSTIVRRSRGYAPAPIKLRTKFDRQILACGAELKNTFCLTRDNYAFVSHHIGDLENLETLRSFTQGIEHYQRLFYLEPEVVAYDLHPEYLSTKYALALEEIDNRIGIQHHHAHIASCMADNQIEGEVIGVAMDGLGFGTDGRLWGGEFFVANLAAAERIAHLDYLPLPGGTKAIREPWRMAAAYLQKTFGDDFLNLDLDFNRELDTGKWKNLRKMTASGTNSPKTSSMGRLFDAVASLLRLRDFTNYEGQAAIELEQIAAAECKGAYEFNVSEDGSIIRTHKVIRAAVGDLIDGVPPAIISARFHHAVADLILAVSQRIRADQKLNRVALSGGVFQNEFLVAAAGARLRSSGFEVFIHHRVPANDGGISLGQAVIANALLRSGR